MRGLHKLGISFGLSAAVAGLFPASPASAAVTINIVQSGNDVVATAQGTFDPTGSNPYSPVDLPGTLVLADYYSIISLGAAGPGQGYAFPTAGGRFTLSLPPFTVAPTAVGTGTGDGFYFRAQYGLVVVPAGFIPGGAVDSTGTFAGQTFDSLGLAVGSFVYNFPHDRITINIGQPTESAVPEPATWAMMLLGFGGIGVSMRRKRKPRLATA